MTNDEDDADDRLANLALIERLKRANLIARWANRFLTLSYVPGVLGMAGVLTAGFLSGLPSLAWGGLGLILLAFAIAMISAVMMVQAGWPFRP